MPGSLCPRTLLQQFSPIIQFCFLPNESFPLVYKHSVFPSLGPSSYGCVSLHFIDKFLKTLVYTSCNLVPPLFLKLLPFSCSLSQQPISRPFSIPTNFTSMLLTLMVSSLSSSYLNLTAFFHMSSQASHFCVLPKYSCLLSLLW